MNYIDDLVSIVTPAWKAAAYVEETVRSVQAQTYAHWEMLIVDDKSPDNTSEVVERLAAADPRIRLVRQEKNGGPALARNAAIERARGRWIAFLDSDDLWLPGKLEQQLVFQARRAAKMSFTQFRRISADGSETGQLVRIPYELNFRRLLGNTAIATSTVVVDRKLTGDFRMKKMYYDDFGCWLDILRTGGVAAGLQQDLMRYRVLGGSVSRNKRRSATEVWKTYRDVEKLGLLSSAYYFSHYAMRGFLKYRRF